jgi:lipoprotein-anchoring transpeptidase ErfK/SrfK
MHRIMGVLSLVGGYILFTDTRLAAAQHAVSRPIAPPTGPVSLEGDLVQRADTPLVQLTPANTVLRISVRRRTLWVIVENDTLHRAPVAVGAARSFTYGGTHWSFATPRGRFVVRAKRTDPVWIPPDWHYAEVAARNHLRLASLPATGRVLRNGLRLEIRDSVIGMVAANDTAFLALPMDEHIVFDGTLFIPPYDTHNRRLHGELGAYALDLGDGYMIHGTVDPASIGSDRTHGCIRLHDADLLWIYTYVPVGASVVIRD